MMAANRFVIFFWDEYEERGMMGSGPPFVLFSFGFGGSQQADRFQTEVRRIFVLRRGEAQWVGVPTNF